MEEKVNYMEPEMTVVFIDRSDIQTGSSGDELPFIPAVNQNKSDF